MLTPYAETQVADIIRDHAARKSPLKIIGGNTRSGFGNAVAADEALSSRAMNGIVSYLPAEMVMTVKAGTPLATVEAALAENRQMMAFEPVDHRPIMCTEGEPTIGGVFAANVSGPRRYVAGAARDSLLGIRFVNGSGEVIKAGGRVMKNVTGLDLSKFLAGSFGTLGFLTEVTFRVLPKPPARRICRKAFVPVSSMADCRTARRPSCGWKGFPPRWRRARPNSFPSWTGSGRGRCWRARRAGFCGVRCAMSRPMSDRRQSPCGKYRSRLRLVISLSRRCAWKRASTPFTTGRAALSGCRWRRTPRRICCAARSGRSAAAMQLW